MATEKKTEKKENTKVEAKEDSKIAELKIELLKSGAKRQRIKREIARILTLQNKNKKKASSESIHSSRPSASIKEKSN
jgi:hypothetical protein